MDTVISRNLHNFPPSLTHPPIFQPNPRHRIFFHFPHSKPRRQYKYPIFCTFYSTSSFNLDSTGCGLYGGWEELDPLDESTDLGSIRRFLASLTTRDGKNAFFFGLGFLSALAISRIRFCTMPTLPLSIFVFVFVAGLSIGVAQSAVLVRLLGGRAENNNARIIQTDTKIFDNKSKKTMLGFMDYLDGEMSELKLGLQKFVDSDSLEMSQIKRFLDVIESVRLAALPAKKSIKDYTIACDDFMNGSLWVDFEKTMRMTNSKSSKRSKDMMNLVGFDFIRYIGALFFHETSKSTTTKSKENPNTPLEERSLDKMEEHKLSEIIHTNESKHKIPNLGPRNEVDDLPEELASLFKISQIPSRYSPKINGNRDNDLTTFEEVESNLNRRFDNTRNNLQEKDSSKVSSLQSKPTAEICNRMHEPNEISKVNDYKIISDDDSQSMTNVNAEKMTPTSMNSNVDRFTQNVHDGAQLLKRAREYLRNEVDEEMAEIVLYKSAELLSSAVALKPMSLLAVGQLGNTLVLHGQLKLKISRDMRSLLSRNGVQRQNFSRSSNSSVTKEEADFGSACEECEELLVEAGRNYRIALSIDGSDTRSLYNWGLALYFRAELIADVGPEAALEADQVYLAAIDKFDATTSRSNSYAVDALYRWGLALRQRSNLRLRNGRDKMKLLRQAKSLFEEVLSVDSNNQLAREALFSCLSEIN